MPKEPTEKLPAEEKEKKAPKKKTAKKPAVDLSDLQAGMENSHMAKVGIEQGSKDEIPKTTILTPGFAPISALEESLRRKQLGTRKPKAITKPKLEPETAPAIEEERKRSVKEKVHELNNLIGFVEKELNRFEEKKNRAFSEGRADKAYELDSPIETLIYEIKMLNEARQAFLNPRNNMTKEDWNDASEVRDNVMGRMDEARNEEISKQKENSPEGMEKRVKKLNELITFVREHKNSLVTKMVTEKDKAEITRLRGLVDDASNRIKILEKAHTAFSSKDPKDALSPAEMEEVEKVQNEVIARMKEVSNEAESRQEEISPEDIEKRVKKLDVLLHFIRNHKNSLVTKMNLAETDKKEVERLKSVIPDMKYRIDVLENARKAFLSKDPNDALTDEQTTEVENVRDEVINKMAEVATKSEEAPVVTEKTEVRIPVTPKAPKATKKDVALEVPKVPVVEEKVTTSKAPVVEEKIVAPEVPKVPVVEEKVESVKETPEISKEDPEKEEALRNEIQNIYNERITSINENIEKSRKTYLFELKVKTQHEQTQSKIRRLMQELLGKAVGKKTNAQEENYLKAEKAYKDDINILKFILNDYPIKDELMDKSFKMGDRGLQILEEERVKVLTETVRQVLVSEKKAILEAIGSAGSEKDRNTVNRLVDLRNKNGVGLLGKMQDLLGINQEENA
jgi:hypothetical protein